MDDQQTYQIIGACMEVHRELCCGFLEGVYQEALVYEFTDRNIPFINQPDVTINYKNRKLRKKYIPDFFCFNEIIVEIKAVSNITEIRLRHTVVRALWLLHCWQVQGTPLPLRKNCCLKSSSWKNPPRRWKSRCGQEL